MSANPITEMQALFARTGVIDSLAACESALNQCLEYLDNRDDCWDTNIDKATDAIKTAAWMVRRQSEDIEDGVKYAHKSDVEEQLRADWKERVKDVGATR